MNAPETLTQGSPEWLRARCGRATSSCFADVLAKGKGKMRATYMRRLLAERITGKPIETYHNGHMDRGQEQEPFARMAVDAAGYLVEEVGFIPHRSLMAGCSPDGLIGDDGGAEIKCVIPTVQIETVLRGGFPPEHKAQVYGNLWITGRQWWLFSSYCPDMPKHLQLYTYRVERDEEYIAALAAEVTTFLRELDVLYEKLMARSAVVQQHGDAMHVSTQA